MLQTFWSKYKVWIIGAVCAIATAVAPLIMATKDHHYDFKALIVMAVISASTYLGREARGKNWTAGGQVFALIVVAASAYQHSFSVEQMLLAIIASIGSVPISPIKVDTYEHAPTILQAKEEAKEIKTEQKTQTPAG